MKVKTPVWIVLAISLTLLLLVGCTTDSSEEIYLAITEPEELPESVEEPEPEEPSLIEAGENEDIAMVEEENENSEEPADIPVFVSDLSGSLRIMINTWNEYLPVVAERFTSLHPDVEITFERVDAPMDISQQAAITTRLLADPPDILDTSKLIFEKFSSEALFVDLNPFLDGENGINRELLFNQVLTGAEEDGSLFHLPLLINTNFMLMNKAYFEAIGVSTEEITTLTFEQYLRYWHEAFEMFPEDELRIHRWFATWEIFEFERVYDLPTGVVNVDTPRMRELFELTKLAPRGSSPSNDFQITYAPEGIWYFTSSFGGPIDAIDPTLFAPCTNAMYRRDSTPLISSHIFMILDHPDMKYSHPIQLMSDNGDIFFRSYSSPAILRDSDNQELAWEFLRFSLTYECEEILWDGVHSSPTFYGEQFPVNRLLFENHVRRVVETRYDTLIRLRTLEATGDSERDAERKALIVEESLQGFTALVSMVNAESRMDWAVKHSLVYPDIYLMMTGQQSIERTLESIQSRLELYVSE